MKNKSIIQYKRLQELGQIADGGFLSGFYFWFGVFFFRKDGNTYSLEAGEENSPLFFSPVAVA